MIRLLLLSLVATTVTGIVAADAAVTVQDPWSRATAGAARVGAVYAVLTNPSDAPVRIISGTSPASERVELHTHEHLADGSVRMVEVETIEIPANGSITLEPGGLHLMLIDLKERLEQGRTVSVTLTTADGAAVPITAMVKNIAAMGACCE